MDGASVRLLQTDLVKLGFMTQRQMDTGPGHFGPNTEKALKAFQSAHNLEADGVYGPRTREALKSALSGTSTPSKPTTKPSTKPTTSPSSTRPHPTGQLGRVYADNSKKAAHAKIDPRYVSELKGISKMSPAKRRQIDGIAHKADLPPALVAGIWYREASLASGVYLHNGDPLGKPTTHVPKGKFFRKDQFVEAAVDALKEKRSTQRALELHYSSTDLGAMATYAEAYNGYGYRTYHHSTSPYAFAGTNQYHGGMYVADGKYSSTTFDRRPGIVAIAQEYMKH
jgi:lysozyme family protein